MREQPDEPEVALAGPRPPLRWRRILVAVGFWAAGLGAVLVALRSSLAEHGGSVQPSWGALGAAALLAGLGHRCGSSAWARCAGRDDRALRHAYYASQLGKYVPGGVWQPLAQIALVPAAHEARARVTTAYLTSQLSFLGVAAVIGGFGTALFVDGEPLWTGIALVAGIAGLPLLHRSSSVWAIDRLPALLKRGSRGLDRREVPSQHDLHLASAWHAGKVLLHGVAFALVLRSVDPTFAVLAAASAFSLAWAVGLIAVPIPTGIGVREAVLVVALGASGPAVAPALAAHLVHRAPVMIAEVVLAGRSAADRAARRVP